MPTYVLYGRIAVSSNGARNQLRNLAESTAQQRGFIAAPWEDFPAGAVAVGNDALSLCFVHGDYAVVEQTLTDLEAEIARNGRIGSSGDITGSGEVSGTLTPEQYAASQGL